MAAPVTQAAEPRREGRSQAAIPARREEISIEALAKHPKGQPLEEFEAEFKAKFHNSLTNEEREIASTGKTHPGFKELVKKYSEQHTEHLIQWMQANKSPHENWHDKILGEANDILKRIMGEHNLAPKDLQAYIIPAELLPKGTSWAFDGAGFIALADKKQNADEMTMASLLSQQVSLPAALHEALHFNAEGFGQHRLEEGAASWMTRNELMHQLEIGNPVNFQVSYPTDVAVIDAIVEKMAEDVGEEKAEKIFAKAYLSGDLESVKAILGKQVWTQIENLASQKKYDDPFLSQEELLKEYLPEVERILDGKKSPQQAIESSEGRFSEQERARRAFEKYDSAVAAYGELEDEGRASKQEYRRAAESVLEAFYAVSRYMEGNELTVHAAQAVRLEKNFEIEAPRMIPFLELPSRITLTSREVRVTGLPENIEVFASGGFSRLARGQSINVGSGEQAFRVSLTENGEFVLRATGGTPQFRYEREGNRVYLGGG